MSIKNQVLNFLENNKNNPVSGTYISVALGVSRNAVWKAINALKAQGYEIEGVTNKGYTLINSMDILSHQSIYKYIDKAKNFKFNILPTTLSTNSDAKLLASNGETEGVVVVSEEQTAGKGRLGRTFVSPKKTGIYMSAILRPKFSAEKSLSITTAAAVAVAKAIEEISGKNTKIKWVNDIYIDNLKVCGILTEASINFENGGLEYAVLGIGINVKKPEEDFPDELKNIAGWIYDEECGDEIRSQLIAKVWDNFYEIYNNLPNNDYIKEYRQRSFLTGKTVTCTVGLAEETGVVVDVDEEARLVIRTEKGEIKTFSAGEANLKKK